MLTRLATAVLALVIVAGLALIVTHHSPPPTTTIPPINYTTTIVTAPPTTVAPRHHATTTVPRAHAPVFSAACTRATHRTLPTLAQLRLHHSLTAPQYHTLTSLLHVARLECTAPAYNYFVSHYYLPLLSAK